MTYAEKSLTNLFCESRRKCIFYGWHQTPLCPVIIYIYGFIRQLISDVLFRFPVKRALPCWGWGDLSCKFVLRAETVSDWGPQVCQETFWFNFIYFTCEKFVRLSACETIQTNCMSKKRLWRCGFGLSVDIEYTSAVLVLKTKRVGK